jgi:hypothetical protein
LVCFHIKYLANEVTAAKKPNIFAGGEDMERLVMAKMPKMSQKTGIGYRYLYQFAECDL